MEVWKENAKKKCDARQKKQRKDLQQNAEYRRSISRRGQGRGLQADWKRSTRAAPATGRKIRAQICITKSLNFHFQDHFGMAIKEKYEIATRI